MLPLRFGMPERKVEELWPEAQPSEAVVMHSVHYLY